MASMMESSQAEAGRLLKIQVEDRSAAMAGTATNAPRAMSSVDPIWACVQREAQQAIAEEPSLGGFIYATVLSHERLEDAICHRLSQRLDHSDVDAGLISQTFQELLKGRPELGRAFRADLAAVFDRDPACGRYLEPLLYFKGFHALVTYRFSHELWQAGRRDFALYLQSQASRIFAVDIHPAAKIGQGIMIDHGHAIGDRHPKIGDNVMIGAGAKILGNIRVGKCSRIAAGSVVLNEVPENTTVAGVPAKVVGPAGCSEPARTMDQRLSMFDPEPVVSSN